MEQDELGGAGLEAAKQKAGRAALWWLRTINIESSGSLALVTIAWQWQYK